MRIAPTGDVAAVALLCRLWHAVPVEDDGFEARVGEWLAAEGDRRTIWLASEDEVPVGMASLFEYRRMPRPGLTPARWGYVSNMFVREEFRGRGVGSDLLQTLIAAAEERDYARLVLSPSERARPFYRRAGFVVPDDAAGDHRLLVRPARTG